MDRALENLKRRDKGENIERQTELRPHMTRIRIVETAVALEWRV
jgi:hypothetical protein